MEIFILIFCLIGFVSSTDQLRDDDKFIMSTQILAHGVRIPEFQVYPTNRSANNIIGAHGVVDPIFVHKNSEKRTWQYEGNSEIFSVPDFFESIVNESRFFGREYTSFYAFDATKSGFVPCYAEDDFLIDNGQNFQAFQYSRGAYEIYKNNRLCYPQYDFVYLQGRHTVCSYEVNLKSKEELRNSAILTDDFLEAIKGLPPIYETNREKYEAFFIRFGTHYWGSARFGGVYLLNYKATQKYYKNNKEKLTDRITYAAAHQSQYNYHGETIEYYYYGQQLPFIEWKPHLIDKWRHFHEDPWIISGNLILISDLIAKEDKRKQVEIAAQAYLDREFLKIVQDDFKKFKDFNNKDSFTIFSPYDYSQLIEINLKLDVPIKKDVDIIKEISDVIYVYFKHLSCRPS